MNELSMKKDKNLPNLKVPVKGKKGVTKFMRKKAIGQMKDAVQSADRKPEKYMKPDGKVGIRMVKVDKEVIKKESVGKTAGDKSYYHLQRAKELAKKDGHDYDKLPKYDRAKPNQDHYHDKAKNESIDNHPKVKAARKAHAAGTWDGNVDKEGEAVVHINGKPHTVTNRYSKKKKNEAMSLDQMMRMRYQAAASQKKNQKKTDDAEKKKMAAKADMDMRARREMVDPMDLRGRPKKRDPYPKSPYGLKHPLHPSNIAKRKAKEAEKNKKESVDEAVKNLSAADQVKAAIKIIRDKRFNMKSQIDKKTAIQKISKDLLKDPKVKKEMDKIYEENVEEALTLQQRMKRSRLMKRMKSRIKIGKQRAMRKMANKKTLEKRAMRQARGQIAKKLTRGIPKSELTFARKQEIEKRLDKPALKARIKRIAKRIFKDVRKKEVQRKKG